jgi:phosphatidylserine/phosphatidylglycerophosphate/cardiolipin synthase-like enzyme
MGFRVPLFLVQGEQPIAMVADHLVDFVNSAKASVHIAIYDFRLKDPATTEKVVGALKKKADAGVDVRIAYDHRNAPKFGPGDDPAPHGTHQFLTTMTRGSKVKVQPVEWSDVPTESIAGSKLMHSKYVIVDGHTKNAAVWMGSTNFTDDAWTKQDNNILVIDSPTLSAFYETDFDQLWSTGKVAGTGAKDAGTVTKDGLDADIAFSPGEGTKIDDEIASLIAGAKKQVHIASMVITSDKIVHSLAEVVAAGRVAVEGIFDGPEMNAAEKQMAKGSTKVAEIERLRKVLVAKHSTPFDPKSPDGVHDFMHNKVVVVDDAFVTGSHNFSLSAERNAENAILVRNKGLADQYRAYVSRLVAKYK